MEKMIDIQHLNFSYDNKLIFKQLDFEIFYGDFITLAGPSSCGKTTLFKIILGILPYDGIIRIDGLELNNSNKNKLIKKIGYSSDNYKYFFKDTVREELYFNSTISSNNIKQKAIEILSILDIEEIIDKKISNLSYSEQSLLSLAVSIMKKPNILLLDNTITYLNETSKKKIFTYLKKLNVEDKMTVINITTNLNDSLYGKNVALISDHKIIANDRKENIYGKEKVIKKCNLELPFVVDLSMKLKYYNLVDSIILNENKLVNNIWK